VARFGVALSVHPVSSHATGEVIGRILDTLGPGADAVVLAVTPGHRGALDDIARTVRTLLRPQVLLAAVAAGVGADGGFAAKGAGIGLWAAAGLPVTAIGGPDAVAPPAGCAGALVLGTADLDGSEATVALPRDGDRRRAPVVVAGRVAGPVLLDGHRPGAAPAGIAFGPGTGLRVAVVAGLRPVGPQLVVTATVGTLVVELDGRPAMDRLLDVAADGMPAADRQRLGDGLHLEVLHLDGCPPDGPTTPVAVLGAVRDRSAIAVAEELAVGTTVRFAVRDPGTVATDLASSLDGSHAAVLLAAPGHGGGLAAPGRGGGLADLGPVADDLWVLGDGEGPVVPASTLTVIAVGQHVGAGGRSSARPETTVAAHFP
jgi:small ligand-binding sensory domain FIST